MPVGQPGDAEPDSYDCPACGEEWDCHACECGHEDDDDREPEWAGIIGGG